MNSKNRSPGGIAELDRIKQGDICPVYLLYGTEDYLKKEISSTISEMLLGDDRADGFNFLSMDSKNPQEIVDEARTFSLTGGAKVLVVNGLDQMTPGGFDLVDLYLTDYLNKKTCLILHAQKFDRKRKISRIIKEKGKLIECQKLNYRQLLAWAERRGRSMGLSFYNDAIVFLVGRTGSDLFTVDQELNKIWLYHLDCVDRKLKVSDIQEVISGKGTFSIFDLLDALVSRNLGRSLNIANNLIDSGNHPIMILTMISREFRMIAKARELAANGANSRQIAQEISKPAFKMESFMKQIRQFSRRQIQAAFSDIADTDFSIRTSNPRFVLEALLIKLCDNTRVC